MEKQGLEFFMETVSRRLSNLEQHVVNLIIPLQSLNNFFGDGDRVKELEAIFSQELKVDTRDIVPLIEDLRSVTRLAESHCDEIKKTLNCGPMGELKYIAGRILNIENSISKILSDGVDRKISLDVSVEGLKLVKKSIHHDELDEVGQVESFESLVNNTLSFLSDREREVVLIRYAIIKGSPVCSTKLAENLSGRKLSSRTVIQCLEKAMRKIRRRSGIDEDLQNNIKKIGNKKFYKDLFGDNI